ncbi:MAG TPA: hypothetical protein VKI61_17250 [Chitinophagaceae bacterium]|nr:hypothetical protein [Chitinophagaceae bacterium]
MKCKLIIGSCFGCLLFFIFISCNSKTGSLTGQQSMEVKENVQKMMDMTASDISHDGPVGWLKYFENTPDFFMASDGQIVFPNYDSATAFIKNTLARQIKKIELHWSNIRIYPLAERLANIGADWMEYFTDFAGNNNSQKGYFTAVAEKTLQGWRLRNAHWSVIKSK